MALIDYQPLVSAITTNNPINAATPQATDECIGINCNAVADIGTLYYNALLTFLYVASVIAFITFLYAGIVYMTAGGDSEKAEKAKKIIIGSVIGILVIIASYAIFHETMNVVNPAGSGVSSGVGGGAGVDY